MACVLAVAICMPFIARAEASPECEQHITDVRSRHTADEAKLVERASHTSVRIIPADAPPTTRAEPNHVETNDKVVAYSDGRTIVYSTCGDAGKRGVIELCVRDESGKETCGDKLPKDKIDLVEDVQSALASGNGQTVQKSLKELAEANKAKSASGALPSLNRRQVLDAFGKACDCDPNVAVKKAYAAGYGVEVERALTAAAKGDKNTVRDIARSLSLETYAGISTNAFLRELDKTRAGVQASLTEPGYFSALERLPVTVTGFGGTIEVGSITPSAQDTAWQLASTPVRPLSSGRLDPVHFAARAGEVAEEAGLVGSLPPWGSRCGMRDGSKGSWAACLTMLTAQESGFRADARGPGGECSYGYGQFCNTGSDCGYGICNKNDVYDPEKVLLAYTEVAKQGQMMNYFGSLQRSEVNKHAGWYNQEVVPYLNGDLAYTPSTEGGWNPSGGYWSGVTNRGSEQWSSPGVYSGFGGGGSLAPATGLLSSLIGFIGGSNNFSTPVSSAPTSPAPPPLGPTSPPAPVINPVITLSSQPFNVVARGDSLLIAWAAVGVSSTRECVLYENTNTRVARATGNKGTYFMHITGSYPDDRISFSLECTPQDVRVQPEMARKTIEVGIQ